MRTINAYPTFLGDLPSADAAKRFVREPSPKSAGMVFLTMAGRSALIAAGLYTVGFPIALIAKAAAVGALSVEVFVLGWAVYDHRKGG